MITSDKNHPDINVPAGPDQQNKVYLVLSDEELAQGFTRPLRSSYIHTGETFSLGSTTRPLDAEQQERYNDYGYVLYEEYPSNGSPAVGRFWTQKMLDAQKGCGTLTIMADKLSATWARDPHFYGATWCCGCHQHLPVGQFTWEDGTLLGS